MAEIYIDDLSGATTTIIDDCGNVTTIPDVVNHPSHYESGKFECIEVMLETQGKDAVMDFCLCNAFKYLYRHNRKNGIEDIKKAKWYIDKYIELAESEVQGE